MGHARGLSCLSLSAKQMRVHLLEGVAIDGLVIAARVGQLDGSKSMFKVEGRVLCYTDGAVMWSGELDCSMLLKEVTLEAIREQACEAALDLLNMGDGQPARPCRLAQPMWLDDDSCPDFYFSSSRDLGQSSCVEVERC